MDEVHNIGTESKQKSLLNEYDFRLGMSATPKRHYDEEGTEKLFALELNALSGKVW